MQMLWFYFTFTFQNIVLVSHLTLTLKLTDVFSSMLFLVTQIIIWVSLLPFIFSADGSSGFQAENGRYHLYVSLACPWAHRTLIVRALKGLTDVISVSIVEWLMTEKGWEFNNEVRNERREKKRKKDGLNIFRKREKQLVGVFGFEI